MSLPLFPAAVVGSMPRPRYVKDLLAAAPRDTAPDVNHLRPRLAPRKQRRRNSRTSHAANLLCERYPFKS